MYALVKDGVVVNIVVWDGSDSWEPPSGTSAVAVTDQTGPAYIGGTYSGGAFTAPPATDSTSS